MRTILLLVVLVFCACTSEPAGGGDAGAGGTGTGDPGGSGGIDAGGSGGTGGLGGAAGCDERLLGEDPPWLTDVAADPEGGYVGVGSIVPAGDAHLWHLDADFELTDLGSLEVDDGWHLVRWDDHWVVWGSNHVFLAGPEGQLLASRELGDQSVMTGVFGAVPTSSGLLVLWADWNGLYLERFDRNLQAVAHAEPGDVCCYLGLTGGDEGVFIHGRLVSLESPVWVYRVDEDLDVGAEVELDMGAEWLAVPTVDAAGRVVSAAREPSGVVLHRFGPDGNRLASVVLPEAERMLSIEVLDDELLVYENPLDNGDPVPVRIWSVSPDLSHVEGPILMGTAVDVSWVERHGGGWRVLGYHHSTTWGSYGELWRYEGLRCE